MADELIVDISLKNAKVYDIKKFDIVKGEKFSLITNATGVTRWFSDNDAALSITQSLNTAVVSADTVGNSLIVITGPDDFIPLKTIEIRVVDEIVEPAVDLGVKADAPVSKKLG